MDKGGPPIIIKKITKKTVGGHHGGAWKVAYADFVTAMMAFFLLMWLLNATSEEQRRGISNYFGPSGDYLGAGGSGGMLAGRTLDSQGDYARKEASSEHMVKNDTSASDEEPDEDGFDKPAAQAAALKPDEQKALMGDASKPFEVKEAEKIVQKYESELFQQAEKELRQAIMEVPELKELEKSLIIDVTPDGLRIQIVDQQRYSMFPKGSFAMYPYTKKLLSMVAKVVQKLPNKISIAGHTDSFKFSDDDRYSNWELSADRANASRRVLLEMNIPQERIIAVSGKADTESLVPEPLSEKNRRISIVLHRTDSAASKSIMAKNATSTPEVSKAPA
ncbi:MAG: OmpA family protein [Alphaproteobacteria bacterium]|nr:OmpA family protein [Alphaproteobacteria bacterium]